MADQSRNNMGQPVPPGLIQRIVEGVKYTVSGIKPTTWMGPAQPISPTSPESKGRELDYPVGYNLQIAPRAGEQVSFTQLRQFADTYDLLRLVIETRKDQIGKYRWEFMKKGEDETTEDDPNIALLERIFAFPDRVNDFHTWLRKIHEDLFVIDAVSIYPRPTVGGGLYALEVIDGATIKRVIDADGRTPEPPSIAYQQVLHGLPAIPFSRDELIYKPRNVRSNRLYGYAPVEQIVMTVNIALRRQLFQLNYYTEGNIPDAFAAVPEGWTPKQISDFQKYWDLLISGNLTERRKMKFLPGGMKMQTLHTDGMKDEYDEWLARVICYCFSVPPTPFVKQMNRATAQTLNSSAMEEGLIPLLDWTKGLLDFIIAKYVGLPGYEVTWKSKEDTDITAQSTVLDRELSRGVITINEWREERGFERIGPEGDVHLIYTGAGAVRLEDVIKEPEPPQPPVIMGQPSGEKPPFGGGVKRVAGKLAQAKIEGKPPFNQPKLPAPKGKEVKDGAVIEKANTHPLEAHPSSPEPFIPVASIKHKQDVDVQSHEAATSTQNDLSLPSSRQVSAGNYKKGHVRLQGLDISIENPKGSKRTGTSPDGDTWESVLQSHYGYIRGTVGADKEHIDVFVGDRVDSDKAYVIEQKKADGSFDEYKVVLGAADAKQAERIYTDNYPIGWDGIKQMVELSIPELKAWLKGASIKKAARKTRQLKLKKQDFSDREKKISSSVKAIFTKQAASVAKQLSKKITKISKVEDDTAERVKQLLDELELQGWSAWTSDGADQLAEIARESGMGVLEVVNLADDESIVEQINELAVDYADARAAELVGMKWDEEANRFIENPNPEWSIDESTRDMLNADVTQAIEEGWSNDRLAKELGENYAFSDSRAMMIARTETAFAQSNGNLIAAKESGVVTGKQSLLDPLHDDKDNCDCVENADAGVISLDEEFPSGDDCPPYHPNCECALVYETSEEDQADEVTGDD